MLVFRLRRFLDWGKTLKTWYPNVRYQHPLGLRTGFLYSQRPYRLAQKNHFLSIDLPVTGCSGCLPSMLGFPPTIPGSFPRSNFAENSTAYLCGMAPVLEPTPPPSPSEGVVPAATRPGTSSTPLAGSLTNTATKGGRTSPITRWCERCKGSWAQQNQKRNIFPLETSFGSRLGGRRCSNDVAPHRGCQGPVLVQDRSPARIAGQSGLVINGDTLG